VRVNGVVPFPNPALSFGLTAMLMLVAALGIAGRTLPLFPDGVIVLTFTLAALAFFAWHSYRLKFVAVDDGHLYVSGWFKHIAIPLSNIQSVDYFLGVRFFAKLIVVRLKSPSTLGATIYFMPTVGATIRASLNSPSVVDDLRRLVEHASKPADAI
jgi:uncharacterized membrane protein YbaN (DUF454 family)